MSTVTVSRWELGKVIPTPQHHSKIVEYLGCDPFTKVEVAKGLRMSLNESRFVAIFSGNSTSKRFAADLRNHRLRSKMTLIQCAKELGVDPKTVRHWEHGRHQSSRSLRDKIAHLICAE